MIEDSRLTDEPGRISALNRLDVLDTGREQSFDKITALVRSVLGVPIAAVSLVDVDRQWFKSMDGLDVTETPRSVSFCSHAIQARSPLNIADALLDARFCDNPLVTGEPYIRAYLGAPLMTHDGYNVGALCAIDNRPRNFTPAIEALLTNFAALVVDEFELRQIAERDHLTGVMTRRAFVERLGKMKCERQENALVLFDVDHFKSVNDRFGHPVGDAVLQQVAKACKGLARRGDMVGRLGGEEFAVALRGVSLGDALARAEEMRKAVSGLRFDFDRELQISASFGVTTFDGKDPKSTLAAADTALYAAKRMGRDQCVASENMRIAA